MENDMTTQNMLHSCVNCALKKEIVLESIDDIDIEEYETIQASLASIREANTQGTIPSDAPPQVLKTYFEVMLEKEAHYKKLERQWWNKIIKKYKISENTKVDTLQKVFYHCIDATGKEMVNFVAKKIPQNKKHHKPIK
jgi:hypothetical protein